MSGKLHFTFLIPAHKAEQWIGQCINSIKAQTGDWSAIVCIDEGQAETAAAARLAIAGDQRFVVRLRGARLFALGNILEALKEVPIGTVVGVVDGDDHLIGDKVVERMLAAYADPEVGVAWSDMKVADGSPIPCDMKRGAYGPGENPYKVEWRCTHMRSFRKEVFDQVPPANFLDQDGKPFQRAYDQALMLPIITLAKKAVFVNQIMYAYRRTGHQRFDAVGAGCEARIRARGFMAATVAATVAATPTNGKSIAYVVPNLCFGGAETCFYLLGQEARRRGYRVGLFGMTNIKASAVALPWASETYEQPGPYGTVGDELIRRLSAYDVIHSTNINERERILLKQRLPHVRFYETYHGAQTIASLFPSGTAKPEDRTEVRFGAPASNTERIKRFCPGQRAETVRNPVNLLPYVPRTGSIKTAVMVARIEPLKNQLEFVEVLSQVPGVKGLLVGGPDRGGQAYLDRVVARAKELCVEVEFTGFIPDIAKHLARADVMLHTSSMDNQPLSLLEAMAHGLPIIAKAVGGVPEMVKHKETGFLYQDPSWAVDWLKKLVAEPAIAEAAARKAYEWVKPHSAQAVLSYLEPLYFPSRQTVEIPEARPSPNGIEERAHPESRGFPPGSLSRKVFEARYLRANQLGGGKSVLDCPCGVGWGTSLMSDAASVVGVDIDPKAVRYAQNHYQTACREFVVGDMTRLNLGKTFDLVVCLEGIEHVAPEHGKAVIESLLLHAAPGCKLFISVPVFEKETSPYHKTRYSRDSFKRLIEPYLDIQDWTEEKVFGTERAFCLATPKVQATKKRALFFVADPSPSSGKTGMATREVRFPCGVGFLISTLRQAGHEAVLCDRHLQPGAWVDPAGFDFVGIYTTTISYADCLKILGSIKKTSGKPLVAVGGPHASLFPESFPTSVDYVVQGEGEGVIVPLVEGKLKPGIIRPGRTANIDGLPALPYDLFDRMPYQNTAPDGYGKTWNMNTSRGCPFSCSFCSVASIWGRKVTAFSAERILREVEHVVKTYGVRGIYFREDNFTFDPARVKAFAAGLIRAGLNIHWYCESRCDTIDDETLKLMADSGLRGLYLGVESGSNRMLAIFHKGETAEQMADFIVRARKLGIRVFASMIGGHPQEQPDDVAATKRFIAQCQPDEVWWNPYREGYGHLFDHSINIQRPVTLDGTALAVQPAADVTVVIPCYQQVQFLGRCLDSVAAQTLPPRAVLIVNDGAPGDCTAAVEQAKTRHPQLHFGLIDGNGNQGQAAARNRGFAVAATEWALPLDADDEIGPDFLKAALSAAANADVVFSDIKRVSDGKVKEMAFSRERLLAHNCLVSCALVRRSLWERAGGYAEELRGNYEDWDFWLRCFETKARFIKVPGPHFIYHDERPDSALKVAQKNHAALVAELQRRHPTLYPPKPAAPCVPCEQAKEALAAKAVTSPVPEAKRADLGVLVSGWNQLAALKLALASYASQTALPREVILADDGSSDDTLDWLDALPPNAFPFPLHYVTRPHSWYRLASIWNAAAAHTKAARLLFTNADVLHLPGSFAGHAGLKPGEVGGGLVTGLAEPQAKAYLAGNSYDPAELTRLADAHPSPRNNRAYQAKAPDPLGCWGGSFSLPKALFEQVHGFDEGYDAGWGGEDTDLVRRSMKAGGKLIWLPAARVVHLDHPVRRYHQAALGRQRFMAESKTTK